MLFFNFETSVFRDSCILKLKKKNLPDKSNFSSSGHTSLSTESILSFTEKFPLKSSDVRLGNGGVSSSQP